MTTTEQSPKFDLITKRATTAVHNSSIMVQSKKLPETSSCSPEAPIASFRASCMRKTRRPQALNVGKLHVTSSKMIFEAEYLNFDPHDAEVTIDLSAVLVVRRACYKRVLPNGVLLKCKSGPDYLMGMPGREQQDKLVTVLHDILQLIPRPKRTVRKALTRFASDGSADKKYLGVRNNSREWDANANDAREEWGSSAMLQFFTKQKNKIRGGASRAKESDKKADLTSILSKSESVPSENSFKDLENDSQTGRTGMTKSFNFATGISSDMVELTLSIPVPDVRTYLEHLNSGGLRESFYILLLTLFLLIITFGIFSSLRIISLRLSLLQSIVSDK